MSRAHRSGFQALPEEVRSWRIDECTPCTADDSNTEEAFLDGEDRIGVRPAVVVLPVGYEVCAAIEPYLLDSSNG